MGKSLNVMGMSEYAIQTFRDGVNAHPGDYYASRMALEIGGCYFDKGDYWLAYNAFDSFAKQYTDSEFLIEGLLGKADALFNDGKYENAINDYLEVLKATNENKIRNYAFTSIGNCYKSLGKLQDAVKSYQMVLGSDVSTIQDSEGTSTANIKQNM